MQDNRIASLVVSLILILVISSACQPAQPAAPASTDAVPVAAAVQPTATKPPPAATKTPTEVPALNPSARGYVSMAYDSESDKIILFGGQIEGRGIIPNGETWAYDIASNTWTEMKPDAGPAIKAAVDLVYDAESDRVILFGGGGEQLNIMSDTWAYDYNTNTWTEMAAGPEDHLGYRMAYDIESDRCILFGGMGYPSLSLFNDTWAYDFNSDTWTEMQPNTSPSARNFHAMAYDAQADRVILFGGSEWDENMNDKALGDTWAYDFNTNTWEELEHGKGNILQLVFTIPWSTILRKSGPSFSEITMAGLRPGRMTTAPAPGQSWSPAQILACCTNTPWHIAQLPGWLSCSAGSPLRPTSISPIKPGSTIQKPIPGRT
jgi:hypothetical protein